MFQFNVISFRTPETLYTWVSMSAIAERDGNVVLTIRVPASGYHLDSEDSCFRISARSSSLRSNLTRADAREFLALAPQAGIRSEVTRYPLGKADAALADLRGGRLQGAAVLIP